MSDELKGKALGTILLRSQIVTQEQLERALEEQKRSGRRLGEVLVDLGIVSPEDVRWGLSQQQSYSFVRLRPEDIDLNALRCMPASVARRLKAVPYLLVGDELTVVMDDPTDKSAVEEIEAITGRHVIVAIGLPDEIEMALDACYGSEEVPILEQEALDAFAREVQGQAGLYLVIGPKGPASYETMTKLVGAIAQPGSRVLYIGSWGLMLGAGVVRLKVPGASAGSDVDALEAGLGLAPDLICIEDLYEKRLLEGAVRASASGCLVIGVLPIIWPEVAIEYLVENASSRSLLASVFLGATVVLRVGQGRARVVMVRRSEEILRAILQGARWAKRAFLKATKEAEDGQN